MDLKSLRCFVEVVKQGGFTRAAEKVFATQSTVSKAVRQLEDEIGAPLLDRSYAPPKMTATGQLVYQHACSMLSERDNLFEALADLQGLRRGVLRIGFPPVGSDVLFAPLLAVYRNTYPDIEIQLIEHGAKQLEELVRNGELDMAATLAPAQEEFEWMEIICEPLILLTAADHALASAQMVQMSALRDLPFVMFSEGFALNPIIRETCRANGYVPQVAARSGQISFIRELVANRMGVAFLPRIVAESSQDPRVRQIRISDASMVWRLGFIWRKGAYVTRPAAAWLELCKTRFSQFSQSEAGK